MKLGSEIREYQRLDTTMNRSKDLIGSLDSMSSLPPVGVVEVDHALFV